MNIIFSFCRTVKSIFYHYKPHTHSLCLCLHFNCSTFFVNKFIYELFNFRLWTELFSFAKVCSVSIYISLIRFQNIQPAVLNFAGNWRWDLLMIFSAVLSEIKRESWRIVIILDISSTSEGCRIWYYAGSFL